MLQQKFPLFLGFLMGIFGFILLRFFLIQAGTETIHYHANFAVFLNAKQIDFSDVKYMEDAEVCDVHTGNIAPEERAHLHNKVGDVVHIHANGVTWGHLMSNIGFAFGKKYFITDKGRIVQSRGKNALKFILNGEAIENPFNKLIDNEDRLLISFGRETLEEVIQKQFPLVASTAKEINKEADPGSCGGEEEEGILEKLGEAVWR